MKTFILTLALTLIPASTASAWGTRAASGCGGFGLGFGGVGFAIQPQLSFRFQPFLLGGGGFGGGGFGGGGFASGFAAGGFGGGGFRSAPVFVPRAQFRGRVRIRGRFIGGF